jgi:ABC-type sulfate/molybdate transport systems ATPase subunit
VLLDEPSTGLDAASTERLVGAVLEERERGAIVVVVTHDAGFAEAVATRRLRLARGRVEAAS